MGITIVDTNEAFSDHLHLKFGTVEGERKLRIKPPKEDPQDIEVHVRDAVSSDIAQAVVDVCKGDEQRLIFINIEGAFKAKMQEQKGVEIVMWLRCKHRISNPILLYSFQSSHQLLKQKPENLIINSDGCYFFQLPNDFITVESRIKEKTLSGVKDFNGLKKFLKPAFRVEEFRHREANWWGIKQLCDVHYALDKSLDFGEVREDKKDDSKYYPLKVNQELEKVNNIIAAFIYGKNLHKIEHSIIALQVAELESQRKTLEQEIYERKPKKQALDTQTIGQKLYFYNENKRDKIYFDSKELKKVLESKNLVEAQIRDINKHINNLQKTSYDAIVQKEMFSLLPNNLKVLHIDDQANQGWSKVFQLIIFGTLSDDNFIVPEFSKFVNNGGIEEKVNQLFKEIEECLNNTKAEQPYLPDIILLDVRLIPLWDDNCAEVKTMSGPILLPKIRDKFPGVPIIITTASNKFKTYEELTKLGADGYWIKEGIDQAGNESDTVENYRNIRSLIEKASSYKFKLLCRLKLLELKVYNENCWWEKSNSKVWKSNEEIDGDTELVKQILHDTVLSLKNLIHTYHMGYGYKEYPNDSYLLSGIINKIGTIVEGVHRYEYRKDSFFSNLLTKRGDSRGKFIIKKFRHESSHKDYSIKSDWDALQRSINVLEKYVYNEFEFPSSKKLDKVIELTSDEKLYFKIDGQKSFISISKLSDADKNIIVVNLLQLSGNLWVKEIYTSSDPLREYSIEKINVSCLTP